MEIKIANYRNKGGNHKGRFKLTLTATSDWVLEHFQDKRLRCTVSGTPTTGYTVELSEDKSSAYRWGKVFKNHWQMIGIIHSTCLPEFGAITVEPSMVAFQDGVCVIDIGSDLHKPIRRSKSRKVVPPIATEIGLRQAVEAVNAHKQRIGDDLCLSVDKDGRLKALIEYGG